MFVLLIVIYPFQVFTVEEMMPVVSHLAGAHTKNLFLIDKKKKGELSVIQVT